MSTKKRSRFWTIITVALLVITVIGVLVAWTRYRSPHPLEIVLPDKSETEGMVQISGAVTNPGLYPFTGDDSIGALLQSAGGATATASPSQLLLTVPETTSQSTVQKININRAEAWLLEALPGIGEARAKAIVAYREIHGPYKLTSDLMKVEGIGASLYDEIKNLVTVVD